MSREGTAMFLGTLPQCQGCGLEDSVCQTSTTKFTQSLTLRGTRTLIITLVQCGLQVTPRPEEVAIGQKMARGKIRTRDKGIEQLVSYTPQERRVHLSQVLLPRIHEVHSPCTSDSPEEAAKRMMSKRESPVEVPIRLESKR